ncbi:MAG: O-antigen ligase family protein [Victivallales bacterium]
MEFTYNGLVRYGYGFANPNHAAALITMLLPFLWMLRIYFKRLCLKGIVLAFECLLYTGLIFTYSRTGFFVLLLSALFFWGGKCFFIDSIKLKIFSFRKLFSIKIAIPVLLFLFIAALAGGTEASGRYFEWLANPDKSVSNRLIIWRGAVQIIADNPQGVGRGRSGLLFTQLYCPPGNNIVCRTMINSFLTFAVEQGLWMSLALSFFLFTVMFSGLICFVDSRENKTRRVVILSWFTVVLAGGLSGIMSTCFDLDTCGKLLSLSPATDLNVYMQSVILLIWCLLPFLLLIVIFKRGNYRHLMKSGSAAFALSLVIVTLMYFAGRYFEPSPKCKIVRRGKTPFISIAGKDSFSHLLFIPDDNVLSIRESLMWLKQNYRGYNYEIPLTEVSGEIFTYPRDIVVLCGKNSFWAGKVSVPIIHLLLPDSILNHLSSSVQTIFLSAFDRNGHNAVWKELAASKCGCEIKFYR